MKVGSIEIEQEIRLCLGYRQTPQRGQQKELSTNHIEDGEDRNGQHRQHGNNGWQLWQIRASCGIANVKQIRASLGLAAQQLRASLGLAANEQIQEPEALGKEKGCRDGNITRHSPRVETTFRSSRAAVR